MLGILMTFSFCDGVISQSEQDRILHVVGTLEKYAKLCIKRGYIQHLSSYIYSLQLKVEYPSCLVAVENAIQTISILVV